MTDREVLIAMFERAGVVWREDGPEVQVWAKDGPKNQGYVDFFAVFYFTPGGALDHTEVWE